MKKVLVAAAALAVLLAACSSSDEVVASVNDVDISRSEVESMVRDAGDGFTNTDFATYLGVVIQWQATEQAASEELGVEVTEDEIDARVEQLVAEFNPTATLDDYLEAVNASESGARLFAKQLVLQEAIQQELVPTGPDVTDEAVAAEIAASPLDWTQVCASHILVATQAEALDIQTRLASGETFADLATELSIDTGSGANGGDLGCAAPSRYVEPFAEAAVNAEIGVVTEPVESEFGFHLILVNERVDATPEQVRPFLEQQIIAAAMDDWFSEVIDSANVSVDEGVGEWVTDPTPQVLATN